MPGRRQDIEVLSADRRHRRPVAMDAPPQRETHELAHSEDLGGVVAPEDGDLVNDGGWATWSGRERLTVLIALTIALALAALVVAVALT
jgi:hypothetical protein